MADEREGAPAPGQGAASENRIQSGGRDANAAQPLNAAKDQGGPERYPSVSQTDAVESAHGEPPRREARSFDPSADAESPRHDGWPVSTNEGRLGPGGDPAEGKR